MNFVHASPILHNTCYFTIQPATYQHFSTETPFYSPVLSPIDSPADPTNPLLAIRYPDDSTVLASLSPSSASTLLQMQTAAAHERSPIRPRPYPVQNVLQVTSDSSTSSAGSTSSNESNKSSLDLARCSRCQRTPSTDIRTGKSNMVQYGLNLWYCNRCAALVGLVSR